MLAERSNPVPTVGVTGAGGQIGTAVQKQLADHGAPVVAVDRTDDWTRLESCDAIIHLAGTLRPRRPDDYDTANVTTAERMLRAAKPNSRIVFLSFIGADPASPNAYLRTKGLAERAILGSGRPAIVFRSSHVFGTSSEPGPTAAAFMPKEEGRNRVSILGDGTQRIAPIWRDDVAAILAAAATEPAEPTGIFEIGGPLVVTADDFARMLATARVDLRHLSPRMSRLLAHLLPGLTPALVDVMLHDAVPGEDSAAVARMFGRDLTPFERAWRGSLAVRSSAPR